MARFVVEFGMGADFHGQDVNKAACKAVKDAVSRSCLCGLTEVLGIPASDLDARVDIKVTVATSRPEDVDSAAVAACLPDRKSVV